uniref:Rootletin-like coiled-coil domain-containing protein n=1 Tax=Oncorhynchus tshawytscha TaxID=74940 RepID=A0A8C8DBX3_ONCTS
MSDTENSNTDSKLESVIQRLEESVLSEEKRLTVRGASPEDPPTCLPARVREIVTKNLNESPPGAMSSVMSVQEENRVLQVELGRLEDLLAHSRADRDELAIKYSAISERLEQALRLETGDGERDSPESRSQAQQNMDLRRRLDEEQAAYKRKLTAYQEGQQRQAQLVQKLQAKVLQYKKRCGDLEQTLVEKSSDSLSAVNAMLREQLEQAGLANEALSQDIRRLTADWSKSREELEQRESDWRREEESFHSYFSSEHSRLLSVWRQVVGFRRQVCELKSATERDLSDMRNELARASHSVQSSCSGLSSTLRSREGGAALALEREVALRGQLELQLRERVAEMMSLQTRTDAERAELNARLLYSNVTLSNVPTQTFSIKVILSFFVPLYHFQCSVSHSLICLCLSGLQEVRGRLSSAQSSVQLLRRQLAEAESAKREAEQRSQTLHGERDGLQREKDTTQRERDRLKQDRDTLARYNQEGSGRLLTQLGSNAELSLLVNKLHSEEAALRDSLAKMGSMNEGLAQDKSDLNSIISQLEEEKAYLQAQKHEAEQEKMTIRDELVRLEQDRLELDSARLALHQSLQDSELSRVGMEAELQSLRADRVKLQDKVTQLCGEVSSLGAELGMARGEEQRQGVALEEVGRGRAELVRERAGLVVQLTASERENATLTEELREALETSLFEVQQQLVQIEFRREQLEAENQSLRLLRETTTVVHVLYLGWFNPCNEHEQLSVFVLQEALRRSLEFEQEGALRQVRQEAEEQLLRAERDREDLKDEVRSLQHDRDQSLLQAETEKQQATVGALTSELLELRSQLEEAGSVHERELHRLQENSSDLQTHTDAALKELEECRASLSASEESRDQVRRDMLEMDRRLNQTRDTGEGYRRDGVELRRTLTDVTKERDTLSLSNTQLRETLRSAETERISVKRQCEEKEQRLAVLEESLSSAQREVTELRSCLREVERSRLEARRELQELRRQVKVLDGEKEQKGREVAELQTRLSLEEQREEERGREIFSLKQKLAEADTARTSIKKEVRREGECCDCLCFRPGKRGVDGRLSSTQAILQQQEETARRGERERRTLTDRVKELERALQTVETEKKHTQDQLSKQRAGEVRLEAERRRLREALEVAEARGTRVELGRRSLEGELQRLKLSLGDREAENQATQERHDALVKQVSCVASLQREVDRLSQALSKAQEGEVCLREKNQSLSQSLQEATVAHTATQGRLVALQKTLGLAEQDRRHLQERVDGARASLTDGKRGMTALTERVQSLQTELTQSDLRRGELEAELAHTQEALRQRSASLTEAQRSAQSAQTERVSAEERLRGLQRAVAVLETEKKDAERQAVRLEKDKNALRNTLDKVERQKLKTEEGSMRLSAEKGRLDRSLTTAEQELQDAQRQIALLQAQLAEMEQSHNVSESSVRQRDEVMREAERLRVAQREAERTLAARERAHRHRVKGLEEQVSTLKEQLQQEMRRRQPSLPTSLMSGGN